MIVGTWDAGDFILRYAGRSPTEASMDIGGLWRAEAFRVRPGAHLTALQTQAVVAAAVLELDFNPRWRWPSATGFDGSAHLLRQSPLVDAQLDPVSPSTIDQPASVLVTCRLRSGPVCAVFRAKPGLHRERGRRSR